MHRSIYCALFSIMLFSNVQCFAKTVKATAPRAQTSTITGHYSNRYSNVADSLSVKELPGGKVKFQLTALLTGTDSPRNGEVSGVAILKNNVAVYNEDGCSVRMEFGGKGVKVTVPDCDACGFGAYVTADGDYKKLDSKTPKFDF